MIFKVERRRRILGMPRDVDFTPVARHHYVWSAHRTFRYYTQPRFGNNVGATRLAMTAVRNVEFVVEARNSGLFFCTT